MRHDVLSFYISGMHEMIIQWIKSGCTDGIDYVMELIIKYTIKFTSFPEVSL